MQLPRNVVEYLLIICDQLKLSPAAMQLALSLTSRFLRVRRNFLPLQLIIMTALMISSKFLETEPPELSTLHKLSSNSFTNNGFHPFM
jgi:hypothetical protein